MNTILLIQGAFSWRQKPLDLIGSSQLSADEYNEVMAFTDKDWLDVDCAMLEKNRDAIFWFSPEAFCYFLPAIMTASIRENKPWLLVVDALIGMLDMSPDPSGWDEFFLARWGTLNGKECEAVQEWLFWLASSEESFAFDNTLDRALGTVELLKERCRNQDEEKRHFD